MGPALRDRPHGARQADAPQGDHHRQHPALAEPVEQPALDDREQRVGDQRDRGDGAGEGVGAALVLGQEHQAEADHRDRQPRDQPGEAEQRGGGGEDPPVGGQGRHGLRIFLPTMAG
ncbi:hypothetical protein [Nocardioides sp. TF02-7]|uniref:hypothetical protein n=1 Tax=Nocardioides sp. TF02-7 TaxID=2917724 RepID=UPI001F0570D0|nr:hypothetical protein [Nocardioides sp. TF02-7]UMG92176.1 hypothetical protein MF408_19960 [Nocardioides sp. TF02-7]